MKKLLKYMKGYEKECVLGPLFKLLEACFDLAVPMVTASMVDRGIANQDTSYIARCAGLLLLLAAIGLTCSITAQFFAAKAAVGFAARLRHALFAHVESLSFSELDSVGTSTLITRMTSDVNQVQSGVNMALRLFLRSPFIVVGAVVFAFMIDRKAALVFVVVIPLLALVVFGIMGISMPLYKKVQQALDAVLGSTRENLTGVRVIRAFHRERDEEAQFTEENNRLTKSQLFVGRIAALTNPVTYVMINLALVALLQVSGVRINTGTLTQGAVLALINYLSQILVELVKLANTIVLTNKALACANRIEGVLELSSSLTREAGGQQESARRGQVSFENVTMRYQGAARPSLEKISFTASEGETIGIIGGTGSGKSTLVSLIPRFYDTEEGRVSVDGQDVRSIPLETLRKKIGIVMQKSVLFQGTIRENLLWGNEDANEQELLEALEISQAMELVEKKERGLDSFVEQGGRNFSGGQRQRLCIARALVRKPEILILDDSSSALDYATDARLRKALKSLSYHPTVFVVSQRTSSLAHADRIIVLEDGEAIGMGTHEELLENCSVYREIYTSQS